MTETLVLGSSSLASLELIKVPAADVQATLVLVHAIREVLDISLAHLGLRRRVAVALVETLVHALRRSHGLLLGLRRLGAGATEEHVANGVTDGGTDSDTTVKIILLVQDLQAITKDIGLFCQAPKPASCLQVAS